MKYLLVLVFPFLFSFTDMKIGGTILVSSDLKLSPAQKLKLKISALTDKKIIATTSISMPKFPQAFVLTPKHLIDPRFAFNGEFDVFVDLEDQDGNKVYQQVKRAKVGDKNVNIVVGK